MPDCKCFSDKESREAIETLIIFKYAGRLTHRDSFLYFYKVQSLQKSSVKWKKCLLLHLPTEIYGETVANTCASTRKTEKYCLKFSVET